jgi:protein SCO1/2
MEREASTATTLRFVLWMLVGVVLLGGLSAWFFMRAPDSGPQIVTQAPSFELIDENGQPFSSRELRGQVYVVQFFFTSCASVCPRLSDWMSRIQDRVADEGDAVRLVSITVDPERDTPEKLAVYAKAYGAIPGRWKFLTGDPDLIEHVVVDGFFQVIERRSDEESGLVDIVHGERFVLVDGRGRVRGYYPADEEGVDALLRDLHRLVGNPA